MNLKHAIDDSTLDDVIYVLRCGGGFDFLENEPDIYSYEDIRIVQGVWEWPHVNSLTRTQRSSGDGRKR